MVLNVTHVPQTFRIGRIITVEIEKYNDSLAAGLLYFNVEGVVPEICSDHLHPPTSSKVSGTMHDNMVGQVLTFTCLPGHEFPSDPEPFTSPGIYDKRTKYN